MVVRAVDLLSQQAAPQLIVTGVCGKPVRVNVAGITVDFICLPADESTEGKPKEGEGKKEPTEVVTLDTDERVPTPRRQKLPRESYVTTGYVLDLDPLRERLAAAHEIDWQSDAVVIDVGSGQAVGLEDLIDALNAARYEGRTVNLNLER